MTGSAFSWMTTMITILREVCLLVKYNIEAKSVSLSLSLSLCVCVAADEVIDTDLFTTHLLTPWVWNDWVSSFVNDNNYSDFKPILNLDFYGEHMPEKRITGSKIDLDLSDGSTYTRVYTVQWQLVYIHPPSDLFNCDLHWVDLNKFGNWETGF